MANYAKVGKESSAKAFGLLKANMIRWEERHAKQVFIGFSNVLNNIPACKTEIEKLVRPYLDAPKRVVANEAKKLIRQLEKF